MVHADRHETPGRTVHPTPYADVNALLVELLRGVRAVLGQCLVGMYLEGSLASGDFDADSDIDFVVVTEEEVTDDLFRALRALHERIAILDTPWAIQLEGSYIPRDALRRHGPVPLTHPNIERGRGERLKLARHDEDWIIHRYNLRERGITLVGPAPQTLIDPISPDDLRRAALAVLRDWWALMLDDPTPLANRGYQSYAVLSLCRILYTLAYGAVASKREAACWAREALDPRWHPLIDRAWEGRSTPCADAPPDDVRETRAFIRYALARAEWGRASVPLQGEGLAKGEGGHGGQEVENRGNA